MKTYEQERDDAMNAQGNRPVMKASPQHFFDLGFTEGADWCKSRFDKIVAEKDAEINESLIQRFDFTTKTAIKLVSRDAMIMEIKEFFDRIQYKAQQNVAIETLGMPLSPMDVEKILKIIPKLAEWEKTK